MGSFGVGYKKIEMSSILSVGQGIGRLDTLGAVHATPIRVNFKNNLMSIVWQRAFVASLAFASSNGNS